MIIEAAQKLVSNEFVLEQKISDEHGIVGIIARHGENVYILVAKKYAYKGLASFMVEIQDVALDQGYDLIFYCDDLETFTVFDPNTVKTFAVDSTGSSKKSMTKWREIKLNYGIPLNRHLSGELPLLPDNQQQLSIYG